MLFLFLALFSAAPHAAQAATTQASLDILHSDGDLRDVIQLDLVVQRPAGRKTIDRLTLLADGAAIEFSTVGITQGACGITYDARAVASNGREGVEYSLQFQDFTYGSCRVENQWLITLTHAPLNSVGVSTLRAYGNP